MPNLQQAKDNALNVSGSKSIGDKVRQIWSERFLPVKPGETRGAKPQKVKK